MDNTLRIAAMRSGSMADGPGPRTVVWLQGCTIRCPGCQNTKLWALDGPAMEHDPQVAANIILDLAGNESLTISGGEPFDQAPALARTLRRIRELDPARHVILYTGHTWDEIIEALCWTRTHSVTRDILDIVDVVVDGPYVEDLDSPTMQWRGSSNQRAIDVRATMASDDVRQPVVLDWDTPTLEVSADGIIGTGGTLEDLGLEYRQIPRCGEVSND